MILGVLIGLPEEFTSSMVLYANEFVTCTLMYKLFIILLANFHIYPWKYQWNLFQFTISLSLKKYNKPNNHFNKVEKKKYKIGKQKD